MQSIRPFLKGNTTESVIYVGTVIYEEIIKWIKDNIKDRNDIKVFYDEIGGTYYIGSLVFNFDTDCNLFKLYFNDKANFYDSGYIWGE